MSVLTRAAKGSPLTHNELDANQVFLEKRHGFVDYNDAATAITPLALAPDTWTTLTNDAAGPNTQLSYLPQGVTSLLGVGGAIDASELSLGSDLLIRHDFTVIPNNNNLILNFRYTLGSGLGAYTLETTLGRLDTGAEVPQRYSLHTTYIYIGNADTRDNPIIPQIKLSGAGTVVNAGMAIKILQYA